LSDDSIRRMLKQTFYPQNYNWLILVYNLTFIWFYLTKSLYILRKKRSYKIMHVYCMCIMPELINLMNEWMRQNDDVDESNAT